MRLYAAFVFCCICHSALALTPVNTRPTSSRSPTYYTSEEELFSDSINREVFPETRSLQFFYNQRYRVQDLWDAIAEKNMDLFDEILRCECVYLDERNESGETALHKALRIPNEDMAVALILAGADIHSRDNSLFIPLHLSCFYHLTNATEMLLERGAEVNAANQNKERAVIFIQTQDDVPVLQMLLSAGAEINFQDIQGETPLHEASAYGAVNNAQFLIDHGANITIRDNAGNTPGEFICACQTFDEREAARCFDRTCLLSDKRALRRIFKEAERRSGSGSSDTVTVFDLWTAIVGGSLEDVEEILNCDCTDANGEPISGCSCVEVREVTQSRTSDWDEGQTALHLAVLQKDIAICRLLLENGARADFPNADGNTPLHLAVRDNSIDIVELFLDQEISADGQNDEGQTALHLASRYGFLNITRLLVEYDAALNLHDEQGATPLEIVCNCLLLNDCSERSCRDAHDIVELMIALNEEDEADHERVVQMFFPESSENNRRSRESIEGSVNDDDDDGSSLGAFVGLLFIFSFVFAVFYIVGAYLTHRRDVWEKKQAQLAQVLNLAGPSNIHTHTQAVNS